MSFDLSDGSEFELYQSSSESECNSDWALMSDNESENNDVSDESSSNADVENVPFVPVNNEMQLNNDVTEVVDDMLDQIIDNEEVFRIQQVRLMLQQQATTANDTV